MKQKLTLNQNIIANIILPHLYTTNIIFFNRVLIASEKKKEMCNSFIKECSNSNDQQFHQYKQIEKSPFTSTHLT